ncbi:HD domain-containing protein [Nocardia brasiliensis]|uniref:HD domain-containing protein n=1 Tax=Nocardia brasiliensis TaxID=37326 RepID=UPI0024579FBA|nr:HD domain-containing protein [Nocardia brasiliensis]
MVFDLTVWATKLARAKLETALPRRWAHVQGVVRQASRVAHTLDSRDQLIAAAWLHDIGYAPDLALTGFHPYGGARFLQQLGVDDRLCALVAHHSAASVEARRRGIELEWRDENSTIRDALWWADMTTTPDGHLTSVESRIDEVRARYGPDHVVSLSMAEAKPILIEAALRIEAQLGIATR